jgi:hypothetical protein
MQHAGAQVTVHTFLLGDGGAIFIPHTLNRLAQLGLDSLGAKDLVVALPNTLSLYSVCTQTEYRIATGPQRNIYLLKGCAYQKQNTRAQSHQTNSGRFWR